MITRFYLAAAHKSSGKTTAAIGLCAAFAQQGLSVQPYKKGPDYIDPLWLTRASGRPCQNLDFHTQSRAEIETLWARAADGADMLVIEGNKGLFDGIALDGSDSNAALAHSLKVPVVLVLDAKGVSRGLAPLVLGYRHFDPDLPIAGIILNRVGGARHEAKLRAVLAAYTDVPVVGALLEDRALRLTERHLGLIPAGEIGEAERHIAAIARHVRDHVDLAALQALTGEAPAPIARPPRASATRVRIGIAEDAAFSFYYPGDREALAEAGAELVPFDTLKDTRLPAVDGLFLGGGFPETQARALAQNAALRAALRAALTAGLPAYAECGGLMYLARRLTWDGVTYPMTGFIPADVILHETPVGHGYMVLKATRAHPWPPAGDSEARGLPAHEFHYSELVGLGPDARFAYEVVRGHGIDGRHDGLLIANCLASYAHLRDVAGCRWAASFVAFVRACAQGPARAAYGL